MINLLESVAAELKIKSYKTLLENNLNFLLWNWHDKYSTLKVRFYMLKKKIILIIVFYIN